ncbi:MAG: DNA helicase RecG, partial [Cyanobacteria bacterium J06632_22]
MLDWIRLHKALSVEAERGFNDLEGNQQRFSEFLKKSLEDTPDQLPRLDQERWHDLSSQYATYSDLSFAQRQHLVADTRRFLYQTRKIIESKQQMTLADAPVVVETYRTGASARAKGATGKEAANQKSRKKQPKTTQLTAAESIVNRSGHPLDQPVMYLKGIGPKNSEKLAKLGLLTVRDVLYYYPRDHIDYAKQVKIRDLVPGETVTVVATVRR